MRRQPLKSASKYKIEKAASFTRWCVFKKATRLRGRHTIGYEYDALDRVTRRTVNSADPTDYTYDNASRLTNARNQHCIGRQ